LKGIGWIGILHVFTIVVWMIINIFFIILNPIQVQEGQSLAELGIAYYSNFPGYLGFDHGSKALIMLLSISLPIGLFIYLHKLKHFRLQNLIALIAGCSGFAFYGFSLMVQASTVEYAFKTFRLAADDYTQSFATLFYDWAMLEGGLSVSIYVIANLLLAVWVIIHSLGLWRLDFTKKFSLFGLFVGSIHIIGYTISWFFLMQGKQNMHDFNEAVGLLFMVWILIISIKMIRGKMKV